MKKEAIMVLEDETFSTVNVLTQLMRLQQVVAGSLKNEDGETIIIKNNRLQTVMDILEETQGKVVIFAVFRSDIEQLAKLLAEKHGTNAVATYYGETPQAERQNIITRFQDPDSELRPCYYDGRYVDDVRQGGGRYTYPDGSTYEGQWVDGKAEVRSVPF